MPPADGENPATSSSIAAVEAAITSRKSVRAYLDRPVPNELISHLLSVAARAPSGTNMQPWRAYVLTGERKNGLCADIVASFRAGDHGKAEYQYYPDPLFDPYLARRRKVGWDLYGLMGIARGETDKMKTYHARNYEFFGAPVGIIFTIDRRLQIGSWIDYGMLLQNVMVAARARGIDSCPQAAFAPWGAIIRAHVPMTEHEVVICGMALGYADPEAVINTLETARVPAEEFVTFV